MKDIKISIVEDDIEFQDWILEELDSVSNIICVSKHLTGEDALAEIPQLSPDIVIMDLTLKKSEIDGIECMLRLKLVSPEIKFLVISAHNNESKVFEALKVGAGAYIHKTEIFRKLKELIIEFYYGGAPMSPGIAQRVIKSFHSSVSDLILLRQISKRENEILQQLAKGFLYKEIADNLGIKESTVKQHTHKIYKKLQVNNRTEAIRKYLGKW